MLLRVSRSLRLLERAVLGRACVRPDQLVERALAIAADARWCMRCGVPLSGSDAMPPQAAPGQGPRCATCERPGALVAFVRLARYRSPLDRLLRSSKERAGHGVMRELGHRLGDEVLRRLQSPPGGWCVVPVPASPLRRLARGMDHSGTLAQAMASRLGVGVRRAVRSRSRSRQASLGRRARLQRGGRFVGTWSGAAAVRGRHVLLVDDIRTTGATLREVAMVVRRLGATSVSAAVVAVAEIEA